MAYLGHYAIIKNINNDMQLDTVFCISLPNYLSNFFHVLQLKVEC